MQNNNKNMKIVKLTLYLFLVYPTSIIFAQSNFSGVIQFESKINQKKIDEYLTKKRAKIKNKQVLESLDKVFSYSKPIKSKLKFFKGEGLFMVEDKLSEDIQDLGQRVSKVSAGGSKEYYYNDTEKKYLIKDCESLGDCFIYDNNALDWKLTQDTKKIKNFIVYKATRSQGKVIAWYTPEIPVGFGPKGEYGLPGLILELEVGKVIFNATKIILNPKDKPKIKVPKDGIRLTFEEYKKEIKKAKESIFGKENK